MPGMGGMMGGGDSDDEDEEEEAEGAPHKGSDLADLEGEAEKPIQEWAFTEPWLEKWAIKTLRRSLTSIYSRLII